MPLILIIDDDSNLRNLLAQALRLEGYEVDHANNGEEALTSLLSGGRYPSLILLDLLMPIMDGFQFRYVQKDHPRIGEIPVALLSETLTESELAILNPNAVIEKPIELQTVLETIRRICPHIQTSAFTARSEIIPTRC